MILSFHPLFDADRQIIFGSRRMNDEDLALIRQAEVILLPQTCKYPLYKACRGSSAHIFPNYEARFTYSGKIGQSLLFKEQGLAAPRTLVWETVSQFEESLAQESSGPHERPFFLKTNRGHEAEGVFFITDNDLLEDTLIRLRVMESSGTFGFVSQECIPTQGNVLRTVILNRDRVTYWKRPRTPAEIITTINRGALIDREWRKDLQQKGKEATDRLVQKTGINLAAVDLIFDLTTDDPEPLFLEINYSFGRKGLGGSEKFYGLLYQAVIEWLADKGFDPQAVKFYSNQR